MSFAQGLEQSWYRSAWKNAYWLPFWLLVALVVFFKRQFYLFRRKKTNAVPVVVVGNISVGGTGKTPLIIYLVERARVLGLKPAIVSRGYGGKAASYPILVQDDSLVAQVGDEPYLLFKRLRCPVVVDPKRARAVQKALTFQPDIIFSDDGLQHYAMVREAEIAVVDGKRRYGNGWLLPIGPLREPISRLNSVDLVLVNGEDFNVQPSVLINAKTGQEQSLASLAQQEVVAVAGIGNPERFFTTLADLGAKVTPQAFADHHTFTVQDLAWVQAEQQLIMTEKDWVKCQDFAQAHWWYLPVGAVMQTQAEVKIDALLTSFIKR